MPKLYPPLLAEDKTVLIDCIGELGDAVDAAEARLPDPFIEEQLSILRFVRDHLIDYCRLIE